MRIEKIIDKIERLFPDRLLLTNDETARVLNWAPATLNIARSRGQGPTVTKTRGKVTYLIDDIAEYILAASIKMA